MKIQSLLLASVVAAGGFALPAFAADSHHGKHKRFSETRITAQLNRQQLRHPGMAGVHRWARLNDQRIAKADKSEKSEAPDTGRDFATANPNPTAATKMLARTGNEMDQAMGLKTPVSDKEMQKAVPLDRVMNPLHSLDTAEIKNQMGEPIGDVRSVLRARYGEKVQTPPIAPATGLLSGALGRKPGAGSLLDLTLPEQAISAIEARALWARYGL